MTQETLKPGDIVRLKSDTSTHYQKLTVEVINSDGYARCIFIHPITKDIRRENIAPLALKRVD
ncbi:hypothetical protein [Segetibacter aerophilus]|uniref:Uncharacterized protein n=1 Tax=Segetibacter aerophilus TaxID=670293 RepID=A0A512B9R2_9BACT|nr:hypothetical protein [Segetibacter aerophilus]GEO08706.1 hypothetical protein SAE01_12020 [Segetibacter aerophilus]